jgi:hypothetical protein
MAPLSRARAQADAPPFKSVVERCIRAGKLRYRDEKKEKSARAAYCRIAVDSSDRRYWVSEACRALDCKPLAEPRMPVRLPKESSQIGTPGFKLCLLLKGTPQLVEYFDGTWKENDRCIFSETEFVETSLLVMLWRDLLLTHE